MPGAMVADDEGLKVLKGSLRELKTHPMNCALGQVDQQTEILLDKTKGQSSLASELKKAHKKIAKLAVGVAEVTPDGKGVILDLRSEPASGTCRRLARQFRCAGLRMVTLKVEGRVIDTAEEQTPEEIELEAIKSRVVAIAMALRGDASLVMQPQVAELYSRVLADLRAQTRPDLADLTRLEQLIQAPPPAGAWKTPARPNGAAPARGQPSLATARFEAFSSALHHAGDDLKAARALPPGNPRAAEHLELLNRLLAELTAASSGKDYERAAELSRHARSTSVRMLAEARTDASDKVLHAALKEAMARIDAGMFTEPTIRQMETLHPGNHFKALIDAQKKLRAAPSVKGCDAVEKAADAYLAHFDKLSATQRAPEEMQEKREHARRAKLALRQMRLVAQFAELDQLPWGTEKSLKLAAVQAGYAFEAGRAIDLRTPPKPGTGLPAGLPAPEKAKTLGGSGGVSAAFWVEGRDPLQDGGDPASSRLFLFKPVDGEPSIYGYPDGGGAPREAMAHALGDAMRKLTGIEFGCPLTSMIVVPGDSVDTEGYNAARADLQAKGSQTPPPIDAAKSSFLGSLQQFIPSKGELGKQQDLDLGRIPASESHKIGVLDILSLNLDRHSGNMMVRDDAAGVPGLVPIDHGLTFPTYDALEARAPDRMNNQHGNALLKMPSSFEPMSEAMAQRLDLLDPAELGTELAQARNALGQQHDGASAKLSDQSISLAQRSAFILKLACRTLSPALIQIMMSREVATLLNPAQALTEQDVTQVIRRYAVKEAEIAALYRRGLTEVAAALAAAGHITHRPQRSPEDNQRFREWLIDNPAEVTALLAGQRPAGYVVQQF